MAKKYNFARNGCECGSALEAGATFNHKITWKKETPVDSNIYVPVDLSSFTAKMQVRKKAGDPVILEFSTLNGRIILNNIGEISLLVSAVDTNSLVPDTYKYDLELTSSLNVVTRLIEGSFEIIGQITA